MRSSDDGDATAFVGLVILGLAVAAIVNHPLILVGLVVAAGIVALVRFEQRRADRDRRASARMQYEERESARERARFLDQVDCYFPFLNDPVAARLSRGEPPEDAFLGALEEVPASRVGTTDHKVPALLPLAERSRHLYVVGRTGSGKTSLIVNLIAEDLAAHRGLAVLAPETELFRDWLLPLVPAERADDVVYFAPGHLENPVTFNPLALETGDDRTRAAGELLTIFRSALGDAELGTRMTPILGNIFSLLLTTHDATLWDVTRLLVDTEFRETTVRKAEDPYLREFWLSTYPNYPRGAHLPILNRLDLFLRSRAMRQALCHPVSTLSIRRALRNRGILFFDLSRLDPGSMLLLGQMLLSKFQLELMRREELREEEREPFHLYADEFQTFAGGAEGTWRELLSRGRRFGLALTLAHQHPSQLPRTLQDEILGNVASIVAFGLGAKDAEVVRRELLDLPGPGKAAEPVSREALVSLRVGEAVVRLGGGAYALPVNATPPVEKPDESYGRWVHERSWTRHGVPLDRRRPAQLPRGARREDARKTRPAPETCQGPGLVLGRNAHAGKDTAVALTPKQRLQHMYVIGSSGTGKSTFLLNCILHGLEAGEGLAVLDPHGDLVDEILARVPDERQKDVVLFDPADREFPVGFNVLSAHSDMEKELLASDLVAVFRRLSTRWGDQMNSILANAILAFLESDTGGTLADLRRFLVEPEFRDTFLRSVQDRDIVYYWEREFPLLPGRPQASLLTRLDTFLRPKLIRNMVSQKESRLDFGSLMDCGQIFLAKLSQGAIGEENAYLLGSLLVAKFHQLALSRQAVHEGDRRPFFLYIDECHNFLTPSMASILAGARKYHLGLVLAHQDLEQVSGRDDVLSSVIANPYTRVCFRLGELDAKKLEKGFSHFDSADLQRLGVGEAICRVGRADHDFNLKTSPPTAIDSATAKERRAALIQMSRKRYGMPREDEDARTAERKTAPVTHAEMAPLPNPAASSDPKTPQRRAPLPTPHPAPRTPQPGHGGDRHRYLQALVKRWAESRGFRSTLEHEVLRGAGRVDIALEKPNLRIAVEVSVTTDVEHELQNIQKGLAAKFDHVAVICNGAKSETALRARIAEALAADDAERVHVVSVEELFDRIDRLDAETLHGSSTVRGYQVTVGYQGLSREQQHLRTRTISSVLAKTLRRLKT